jgi:hypothetical protein
MTPLWTTLLAVALVGVPLWWVDRWLVRDRVAYPDPPEPVRDPAAEHLALAAVFDRLGEPGLARVQRDLAVALGGAACPARPAISAPVAHPLEGHLRFGAGQRRAKTKSSNSTSNRPRSTAASR